MVPPPLYSRSAALFCALALVGCLAACGRNQSAPVSDGAEAAAAPKAGAAESSATLGEQTEQKLDPLTADDVQLYLTVMHAAARRVQAPTPEDRATLSAARELLARRPAKPTADDAVLLDRATEIATAMDQVVAREMNIDGRTYRGIAEAIEAVVPNPALTTAAVPGLSTGALPGPPPPIPTPPPTTLETRLREINAANGVLLQPYRAEIQELIGVVRNPRNLPVS